MPTPRIWTAILCAVACWAGSPAWGQSAADGGQDALVRGEFLFRAHCAACHGAEGRGDGPAADDLRKRPADLTRLQREDEAEFPGLRVHQVIDGRLELAGHGSREMPIWGLTFRDPGRGDEQDLDVAETIDDLVVYLRSIQVESP